MPKAELKALSTAHLRWSSVHDVKNRLVANALAEGGGLIVSRLRRPARGSSHPAGEAVVALWEPCLRARSQHDV